MIADLVIHIKIDSQDLLIRDRAESAGLRVFVSPSLDAALRMTRQAHSHRLGLSEPGSNLRFGLHPLFDIAEMGAVDLAPCTRAG